MPAPIVLSTLTPETKKVVNPPAGQPVIATKADLRDGSRPTSVGGGDPVDPGAIDWVSRLTRTDPAYTQDANFDPLTDIQYVGAFRIPWFSNDGTDPLSTRGLGSMTFKPADGSNGANGSLFIGKTGGLCAEVSIPALRNDTTDYSLLNPTTVLQGFTDLFAKAPSGNPNNSGEIGWLRYIDGKLFVSGFKYYDTDGNTTHLLICNDPTDLENSTYQGFLEAYQQDRGARYCLDIPVAHQATFGHTHFCGVSPELAIVSRSSLGHSLIGFTPSNISPADTVVASTEWVHFPSSSPVTGYDAYNQPINEYYASIVNPPGTYDLADYYSPGDILYNNHAGNPGSIGEYTSVPLGEPGRLTTFEGLPLPDESIRKHVITYLTRTGTAFIPEGTDTVVFLGENTGSRYGISYKNATLEDGPAGRVSGGPSPISKFDSDPYIWMMNLNDITAASATGDMNYYRSMPFTPPDPFVDSDHKPLCGHYERSTGKLYVLLSGFYWSLYNTQHVVVVYQVGGGG